MLKKLLHILCFLTAQTLVSQNFKNYSQTDFILPFEGKNEIIGTFCELRPNHFHGGLDIRTDSKIGRHVLSIADGYVSRINISTSGYGKALYITHKNGYTSVYAHLNDFPPSIKWYITKNQYLQKKFEIELYPEKDVLKVKQGEMIAYSGNTGGSQGPHLHFEIRDSKTEEPINPLLFGLKMKDILPPTIQTVYIYRQDSLEKLFNGHFPSVTLNPKVKINKLKFGTYSFGANMKDVATSLGDNNGVNYIEIYKNDELFYQCDLERFSFENNRMFNNYIDYRRHKQTGVKSHKLFKDDGSLFDFWKASPNDGWFEVKDTVPIVFKIIAKDVYGNKREKMVTIVGDSSKGLFVTDYLSYNKSNLFCESNKEHLVKVGNDCEVFFPKNTFYSNYKLIYFKNYSNSLTIGNSLVPIDKRFEIRWKLTEEQLLNGSKYTICYSNGKSIGGELNQNILVAKAKELGVYYLTIDSIPPKIQAVSLNKKGYFSFKVSDNLAGIKDFDFYINGVWVLLEYEYKNQLIFGNIPTPLVRGKHKIQLFVRDHRNNQKEFTKTIEIP